MNLVWKLNLSGLNSAVSILCARIHQKYRSPDNYAIDLELLYKM